VRVTDVKETYRRLTRLNDMSSLSTLVTELSDVDAEYLYNELCLDKELKDKLIRPLWYDYDNQSYRF
jgi:hypothetical protein